MDNTHEGRLARILEMFLEVEKLAFFLLSFSVNCGTIIYLVIGCVRMELRLLKRHMKIKVCWGSLLGLTSGEMNATFLQVLILRKLIVGHVKEGEYPDSALKRKTRLQNG